MMGTIYKTGCVLCAQNCGLEIEVEANRIVKVKGDKINVKSEGYVCRKGLNVAYHQHNADRLKYPLKKSVINLNAYPGIRPLTKLPPNSKALLTSMAHAHSLTWGAAARAAILRRLSASA